MVDLIYLCCGKSRFFIPIDNPVRSFIHSFFSQLKQYVSIYNNKSNILIIHLAADIFTVIELLRLQFLHDNDIINLVISFGKSLSSILPFTLYPCFYQTLRIQYRITNK